MEEELVNICRLCIEVCKNYDLIDVFSENGRSKELVDKIEKYLSLTVSFECLDLLSLMISEVFTFPLKHHWLMVFNLPLYLAILRVFCTLFLATI